ncbi:MAG TPA: TraB/GumN family protein [Caulobacteraceae bacterium]|jgi:uncharacterized protein YbaP (TraB family)|nr:TraB/GumN family protein [Caulobacteraceae bacterium]
MRITGLAKLGVLAAAALAWLGTVAPAGAEPPVWRIHKGGAEVILFGSVHLLNPGQPWETPRLMGELAQAQSVWFEIPFDGASRAGAEALVARLGKLPKGKTLTPLLSPVGRARLARVTAALGVPAAALEPLRPWFAEVTLTVTFLQARGATQGAGVEETLAALAPATAQRRAFETPEEQVALLAGAGQAEQVASLEETLRQIEDEPAAFDVLQKAWVDGDVAAIVREGVAPMRRATPGLYRRLVVQRNRRWADRIERLLKTPERAFIVVGVGHLVGPDSVPALLRRRGVAVEGP